MSSPTGLIFSYGIGLIFLVGGVVFILFLDDDGLLFGIPYLILGLLMIGGVRASQRRRGRREAEAAAARDADAGTGAAATAPGHADAAPDAE